MKKVISILLILLILTSCTKTPENKGVNETKPATIPTQQEKVVLPQENSTDNQENSDSSYFGQYQMAEEGFSQYIKDNTIDKDYETESAKFQESPEFSTQGWVELESKYAGIWDKELNNIYNKLLKKLNEKEQEKLRKAQKGWLQFHINEPEFVGEAWEDLGLGSQGRVQLITSAKNRIRARTLQLMEYYYMLGGEVEFLYKAD